MKIFLPSAHMMPVFITYLLQVYGYWLFASAMFSWLGSVLYRTTRNTLNADFEDAEESSPPGASVRMPAPPIRKPLVPMATAA